MMLDVALQHQGSQLADAIRETEVSPQGHASQRDAKAYNKRGGGVPVEEGDERGTAG